MKLITFSNKNKSEKSSIGAFCKDHIVDFSNSNLPNNMIEFIERGEAALSDANDLIAKEQNLLDINDIIIHAPIKQPGKILAVGLNYKNHLDEVKSVANHHSDGVNLQ